MNKREFLNEIRAYLEKAYIRLNPVEIEDIIRDYEEYFREGLAEGKSEKELVDSMGDPKSLVDEMVENDIEDGKYSREDFKDYFNDGLDDEENNRANINPKNVAKSTVGFFGKLGKLILAIIVVIFDVSYFPAVVLGGLGVIFGTLMILLPIPYSFNVFSIIGQNRLLLIFPIMFVIGAVILEGMITWVLVKIGIRINKMVFERKKD